MYDGEWVLTYPGVSLSMGGNNGTGLPQPIYHREAPDLGDINWTTEDSDRPRADGTGFGADYYTGRTITFALAIQAASEAAAHIQEAALARAWHGLGLRESAGAVAELATQNAGRQRLTYGRPRRFGPPVHANSKIGLVFVDADFACATQEFYDTTEESVTVTFLPPPGSGFVAPFVSPFSTAISTTNWGGVTIGGDEPTWPRITITGPITNPIAAVTGQWTLALTMTIPAGQAIVLDTRPATRSIRRVSDGASFAGNLTRASRLDRAKLAPGSYAVSLGGTDPTGTSSMQFAWRKAYTSL